MTKKTTTPTLFLSELLKTDYKRFWGRFHKILQEQGVTPQFLPNTADIWARDYMPVQIGPKKFVQFRYEPDYLLLYPDEQTDPDDVTAGMDHDWHITHSELLVDGGNIVRHKNTVMMCEKVLYANSDYYMTDLIEMLKNQLEADRIIFLPWAVDDEFGHADGIARFVDEKTVLINQENIYEDEYYQIALRATLHNVGLTWIELPFNTPEFHNSISARGLYLNYLELGNKLFVPKFNLDEDAAAAEILARLFPQKEVIQVLSNEIARQGGVLNCIAWEVYE